MKIIKWDDCKLSKWAGGETREYVIYPEDSNVVDRNFDFRISSATVELETSTFTPFNGYDRFLMILDGQLSIHHQGQYSKQLNTFYYDLFSGDWVTTSEGKVIDFNVIYKRGLRFDFKLIDGNKEKTLSELTDFEFIFILQGSLQINEFDILSGTLIQYLDEPIKILSPVKLLLFNVKT